MLIASLAFLFVLMGWYWCCCTNACAACANVKLNDDFSGNLAAYTYNSCSLSTPNNYSIVAGRLQWTPGVPRGSGALYQSFTIPALNGLCMSVEANLFPGQATSGIFIGGIRYFNATGPTTSYQSNQVSAVGCGSTTVFTTSPVPVAGDLIRMIVQDTSSGGGTYSITYCVNGTQIHQETSVSLTLTAGGSINIGVTFTSNAGVSNIQWDNLLVATS